MARLILMLFLGFKQAKTFFNSIKILILLFELLTVGIISSTIIMTRKIVSEYHQEIPQSQITDNPMAPRGRATIPHFLIRIILIKHFALDV